MTIKAAKYNIVVAGALATGHATGVATALEVYGNGALATLQFTLKGRGAVI